MQFNTVWVYGGASLADPFWVAGATLWGALTAKLALRVIRTRNRRLRVVAPALLALVGSRVGTHIIANLLQVFLVNASNSYSWGPFWVAIPIGAVILAFRLAQPTIDPCLSLARSLATLNCAHALWAMMFYPSELFRLIEPETRPGFETVVSAVPIVAISGVLALLALQISVGDNGRARGWREWFSARLQLAAAAFVLWAQIEILGVAALPFLDRALPWAEFAIGAAAVIAVMAILRVRAQRRVGSSHS